MLSKSFLIFFLGVLSSADLQILFASILQGKKRLGCRQSSVQAQHIFSAVDDRAKKEKGINV